MKLLLTLLLGFTVSVSLLAENNPVNYQVSGQIIEKLTGKEVPYATVVIQNDSIKAMKVQACDGSGRFSMNLSVPQNYVLNVSAVGFKKSSIPVNVSEQKTDLGKLSIEEGIEVEEVTITAQKPLVKVEVDKIVYSLESDPEAQTNNALEMLRKVPLVTVDAEENITLNGQSNFKVLVNGKSSSMMSTNFKEVLKSMPANTIKNIEVITNPSSKYDAEGVGGIINIITSKKTINGYNGSVSGGIDSRGSFNGSIYLATKIKKFSFSGRYYGNQFKQPESEFNSKSEYFNNTDYHYSTSSGKNFYKGLSNGFSGEASYDIDSLNLISLSFWGYQGGYNSNSMNETQYQNTLNDITRMYTSATNSRDSYGSLSGNIDYQKTYKKPDKSLTFSYKLDNNPNIRNYDTDITGITSYPSYRQRSENNALGREQTFQTDYYDPLTKMHQIECGVKFILRQNTSNSEIFRDSVKVDNANDLDYDQYILGAYLGYLLKFEKLSIKTGMRLERTWNNGVSKTSGINTNFTNRLFNLVPYITFSYMPKASQTIKLSYTQRLSRPDIWYLNPYVNNVDSMNISYGNPKLDAEISHSFELGYTYFDPKFNISATSFASLMNNSIENIMKVQANGAMVSTYENIGNNQRYGINLYASYRPSPKLNIYLNGGGDYCMLETNNDYNISNKGFSYRGSLGGRLTLWKDGSVNVNGGIYSPSIMLQGKSSTFFYTGMGVSQYLLKRKLMFSVSVRDPFWYKKKYTYETKDNTFYTQTEQIQLAQTVRFSVTYNFGKMDLEVKKARRGIQNDDLKSGGGSKGGEGQ
jgi:outer membrane receptor protein involved in Fe transport